MFFASFLGLLLSAGARAQYPTGGAGACPQPRLGMVQAGLILFPMLHRFVSPSSSVLSDMAHSLGFPERSGDVMAPDSSCRITHTRDKQYGSRCIQYPTKIIENLRKRVPKTKKIFIFAPFDSPVARWGQKQKTV